MNIHLIKENTDRIPLKYTSWRSVMIIRPLTWLFLAPAFALLLLTAGFADTLRYGAEIWKDRPGQQDQIWSRVNYDPKLSDTFFESNGLLYSTGYHPFKFEAPGKGPHRKKHTAECFSNAISGRSLIKFCDARFIGPHRIDLLIHVLGGYQYDGLRIWIRDGKFKSQYWGEASTICDHTTRQKLTLDKKTYQKGDVIKGRIDFECIDSWQVTTPHSPVSTIKIYGFFKTIVE